MAPFDPHEFSTLAVAMRRRRAQVKAAIPSGHPTIIELFDQASEEGADPALSGLRTEWFLRAVPGLGVTKVARILEALRISPTATLGGLRVRQRAALRREVVALYRRYFAAQRGTLVVVVGPSGVGKGTIVSWITRHDEKFVASTSATTRAPRRGESEGDHYFFVSASRFDSLVADDELLEWAVVHGEHRYGTPREAVEDQLDAGRHVILEIDVQGAKVVKRRMKNAFTIFIAPPSFEELERRLVGRGTEDDAQRRRRLTTAEAELTSEHQWDARIVNDDVALSGQSIVDLVKSSHDAAAFKE